MNSRIEKTRLEKTRLEKTRLEKRDDVLDLVLDFLKKFP
jgi:hypothetical protein